MIEVLKENTIPILKHRDLCIIAFNKSKNVIIIIHTILEVQMKKAREVNKNENIWMTNFPKLLKLTNKERELNPNVLVAYKRPQTIAAL